MARSKPRVYQYAACGTCKKALRWLDERGVAYESVAIVDQPPTAAALRAMVAASGLPVRKFLNTSGQSYRALVDARGKSAVDALDDDSLIALLAADGKMIKRPLVQAGSRVLVGFREPEWEQAFGAGSRGV